MSWGVSITSFSFVEPALEGNHISIEYMDGSGGGSWVNAGGCDVDGLGNITSAPNPFVISGLPDSWSSVRIRCKSDCREAYFIKVFNNPNLTICVPVAFLGDTELPDAIVGTAYSFSINLIGTPPFSIDSIIKPSWMDISVEDGTITISGTPDEAGENAIVYFYIYNCEGNNNVIINQTINISL